MKKAVSFLLVLIFAAIVGIAVEAFLFLNTSPGSATQTQIFEVPKGSTLHSVALRLQKDGLVSDAAKLRVLAKATGMGRRLKEGEYLLNRGMKPRQILQVLVSGKSIEHPVTFPEGTNIYEMADILQKKGIFTRESFLKAAKDSNFAKHLLGDDVSTFEGYLFPETYMITKFTTPKELIQTMAHRFLSEWKEIQPKATISMSRHDAVILASIIEKETGAKEERALISSVFHNRLKKGMRLQSDPTILYGLLDLSGGEIKKNITKKDILAPTRYNTYTVRRLPYGPITNPGKEALLAAIRPAQSEYLYFVSRNDGTHVFSKTYAQQLKAVRAFQLDPRARQGKSWRNLAH